MPEHRYAFVVRIWFEPGLRGSIQSIDDSEVRYFAHLEALPELLRLLLEQERFPVPGAEQETPEG